jgi:MFS family permease
MLPFGLVLVVRDAGGSYGEAGATVAAYTAAVALSQPLVSRLVDRRGQRRTLLPRAFLYPLLLILLALLIRAGAPLGVTLAAAAAAGSQLPPVPSALRVLLSLIPSETMRYRAYALDAVLAEVIWVAAPVTVTLVVTVGHPAAVVGIAAASAAVGTLAFVSTKASRDAPVLTANERGPGMITQPLSWVFVFSMLSATAWGGLEVGMPIFAEEHGNRAHAGIILGCLAAGSLVGGLVLGTMRWTSPVARMVTASTAFGLLAVAPLFADSLVSMSAVAFVLGIPMSTALAAMFALIGDSASAGRRNETFAWTTTTFAAGTALGVQMGGLAGDEWGFAGALVVSLAAALLASLAARGARRAFARAEPLAATYE